MTVQNNAGSGNTSPAAGEADWMMYRVIGVRHRDLDDASPVELGEHLRALDRRLIRERNKGLGRHWSYDLNRHIVLKTVRDMVAAYIEARRHGHGT
ncbi:hypothetical protein [Oceaniradius stylonematis]|jgi:hypothetical protein|uniref:hypothetical protein n=1 Tax=Oceaniradius stylonematis TaxID=2184161 RepID=UPI00273FED12|nr:hypothetical protein [Oceaniradius stylonematis]